MTRTFAPWSLTVGDIETARSFFEMPWPAAVEFPQCRCYNKPISLLLIARRESGFLAASVRLSTAAGRSWHPEARERAFLAAKRETPRRNAVAS